MFFSPGTQVEDENLLQIYMRIGSLSLRFFTFFFAILVLWLVKSCTEEEKSASNILHGMKLSVLQGTFAATMEFYLRDFTFMWDWKVKSIDKTSCKTIQKISIPLMTSIGSWKLTKILSFRIFIIDIMHQEDLTALMPNSWVTNNYFQLKTLLQEETCYCKYCRVYCYRLHLKPV